MALPQLDQKVIADAYEGTTGRWLYEGFDADQWLAIAEDHRKAKRVGASDEAYAISNRLQGLDNNA